MANKMLIGKDGKLNLPEEQRRRWGLVPGEGFFVRETPEGLLVRPADPPLSKVYVEPTTDCNLNCRICMRNSWEEPEGKMKMATYRLLVEGLREVPSLQSIAFWGFGEPLLHPNLVEMIQSAKALGVKAELITNGLLLNRKIAEELVMADLDTLVVSIDGVSKESYGDIRSGADIRMVQDNIKALRAARWANSRRNPEIGLEFVLMRDNLSELPKLPGLAFQMGASFIVVTNVLPYSKELAEEIMYWLTATDYFSSGRSKWFPEIILPRLDVHRDFLDPLAGLLRKVSFIDSLKQHSNNVESYCRFVGEGSAVIAWDGRISPCVALMHSYTCYVLGREKSIRRYIIGDVRRQKISQIWNSEEYRNFRARVLQFDFAPCIHCGGCDYSESNEEDCFGNTFPVCGDCLWARGIILCP